MSVIHYTPQQISHLRQCLEQYRKKKVWERNLHTAFTFGKSVSLKDLDQENYAD